MIILCQISCGESATSGIDRICFTKDGFLNNEFENLFRSLFKNAVNHIAVIKALAQKGKGLTRNELIERCHLQTGGGTTQLLEELRESGFIEACTPYGRSAKDPVYKLIDEFSLFFVKYMENGKLQGPGVQIDLLIDRQDQCINIWEMKFSKSTFEITKRYAEELQTKLDVFQAISKTNKTLFLTMVTTYGIKNKSTHLPLIQHDITMEVLFNHTN